MEKFKTINSELEYERASILRRKLRLLKKDEPKYQKEYNLISKLVYEYEQKHWDKPIEEITDKQIKENDEAEKFAEFERAFLEERKQIIKSKLKEKGLNQRQLTEILGFSSVTHTSEVINGIANLTLIKCNIISRTLGINLSKLVCPVLSFETQLRIKKVAKESNTKLLSKNDLQLELAD